MDASRVPQYAAKGALASTDDFFAGTTYMDTSVLPTAAVNAAKFKGTNYGVPFNLAPMMLYYNKDMFKKAGLDPDNLPQAGPEAMNFQTAGGAKAWRDIWGSGQGIGAVKQVLPTADMVARLDREYAAAKARIA